MNGRSKNHTLKGGTFPYSLCMGVPPRDRKLDIKTWEAHSLVKTWTSTPPLPLIGKTDFLTTPDISLGCNNASMICCKSNVNFDGSVNYKFMP